MYHHHCLQLPQEWRWEETCLLYVDSAQSWTQPRRAATAGRFLLPTQSLRVLLASPGAGWWKETHQLLLLSLVEPQSTYSLDATRQKQLRNPPTPFHIWKQRQEGVVGGRKCASDYRSEGRGEGRFLPN